MKKVNFTKRMSMAVTLIGITVLLGSGQLFANDLGLTNLSYSQANGTVTFTVSWQHGWRTSALAPNNWDAVWVFVKWRDCSADNTVQFTHGLVSSTTGDHSFGSTLEPTKKDGTAGIDASPNNTGVMLRNTADPYSGNPSATVTLKLTNFPASGSLDVRVFGLEMVFIPQGSFTLGDGSTVGTTYSTSAFATSQGGSTPISITSESTVTVYDGYPSVANSSCNQECPGGCALGANFPKGFGAFYLMKYEISQGQYSDFLNAINFASQNVHFPGNNGNTRQTITNTGNVPTVYVAQRPSRACNYLTWGDLSAYLSWAALRPMTELEFEKACRGPNTPIMFETAWGATGGTQAKQFSGAEDGTETITTFGANINASSYNFATAPLTSGDGVYGASSGPIRCGIFATSFTSTRNQTGAGYYGNMELSGNVWELTLSARAGSTNLGSPTLSCNGWSTTGVNVGVSSGGVSLGVGVLTATGDANVSSWPVVGFISGSTYEDLVYYVTKRGGGWDIGIGNNNWTNVSYRYTRGDNSGFVRAQHESNRGNYANSGGRGAR